MNPLINFCITAFVATSVSGLLLKLLFSNYGDYFNGCQRFITCSRFPLINAVADMFKGMLIQAYRVGQWQMLTLATCFRGVILAMAVWGLRLGIITIFLTLIEDMILAAIPAVGFDGI